MIQRRPSPLPPLESSQGFVLPAKAGSTPLPILKIMPLLLARIAEGTTYTVIFPYINSMLLSFGVKEEDLGFYAGIVESSLMVAEATSAPLYAPLADRVGRRPVILVLLACWTMGGLAFGFCTSVWSAVGMRTWLGLLAGCGVLSRTMLGEMCDKSNRVQGFAVFSPSLTIGMTLGPLIGGLLAEPVPRILPHSFSIFRTYPYLLPAGVVAVMMAAATLSAVVYLKETLSKRPAGKGEEAGLKQLVLHRPFQKILLLYSLNNGVMFCWEAIYPLFLYTRCELGGIGLPVHIIGVILALAAMLSIVMTAFVFPLLHRKVPEDLYMTLCLTAYPVGVFFFPAIWLASRNGLGLTGCLLMAIQIVFRRLGDFASTLLDTVVLDAIPGPEHLAMANSLTFSTASAARAIAPFLLSWCFSISTTLQNPWRQIVWITFFALCIPSVMLSRPNQKPRGDHVETEESIQLLAPVREV